MSQQVLEFFKYYQDLLTCELGRLDDAKSFHEDPWQKPGLGSGRTRVLENGAFFERAGIGYSEISGKHMPKSLLGQYPELDGQGFSGAGVSMVLHPKNPYCPTAHLNFRYFESDSIWWFGGGCDLTPYYAYQEDCVHWHQVFKNAMDRHDKNAYHAFKYWCDEYFYNHHRSETRGVGGVFYDYQSGHEGPLLKADMARKSESVPQHDWHQPAKSWSDLFAFQYDVAMAFTKAYLPIIARHQDKSWGDRERNFQLYRRGRYVEFNLLHDRGTLFGLQSKGRVESILMSMPPMVSWQYCYEPEPGSQESQLTEKFLERGINWV